MDCVGGVGSAQAVASAEGLQLVKGLPSLYHNAVQQNEFEDYAHTVQAISHCLASTLTACCLSSHTIICRLLGSTELCNTQFFSTHVLLYESNPFQLNT